jgi:SET domain-containing protein
MASSAEDPKLYEGIFGQEEAAAPGSFVPSEASAAERRAWAKLHGFKWTERNILRTRVSTEEEAEACDCTGQNLNQSTQIECMPSTYACGNRALQLLRARSNAGPRLEIFDTGTARGYGVRTLQELMERAVLVEYVGLVYDKAKDAPPSDYAMTLDRRGRRIDAQPQGNESRFINHSCEPNCQAQAWMVPTPPAYTEMQPAIAIVANCNMKPGTELTFDYALSAAPGGRRLPCLCGAANCRRML